ncbi:MAG: hypothetical protein J5529_08745 [Prevotella sp.]|jgi:hypothetical protein|nr:hypothetical protein [Prevotella sp.]
MHILKLFLPLLSLAFLLSCGSDTCTLSEVTFSDSLAYVSGKPYTGDIMSDDHSCQLHSEDGRIVSLTLYHADNVRALTLTSPDDTLSCFDEAGNPIPLDSFVACYEPLATQLQQLTALIAGQSKGVPSP